MRDPKRQSVKKFQRFHVPPRACPAATPAERARAASTGETQRVLHLADRPLLFARTPLQLLTGPTESDGMVRLQN